MRISSSCRAVLWAAALPLSALAAQVALISSPETTSTTLVDALNADPAYTDLLRLLQRTRLIPTLNKLNRSTLFAPTNDAIRKHSLQNPLWFSALEEPEDSLADNILEELRQQLFYHYSPLLTRIDQLELRLSLRKRWPKLIEVRLTLELRDAAS